MSILVGPVTLSATGGTISSITGYRVHIFSTPGVSTFIPSQNGTIEVLVVGGGGIAGGAGVAPGGGGGGAVVYNKFANVTSGTPYPITVGSPGGISSCTFNNATIIARGGGAGGSAGGTPSPNASGGGGGAGSVGGTGAGVTGLGFPGGTASSQGGGGGGGSGGTGQSGISLRGGNGGIGVSYSITGISSYYGAGGNGYNNGSPFGLPNGGISGASFGRGAGQFPDAATPGAVIIRYPV